MALGATNTNIAAVVAEQRSGFHDPVQSVIGFLVRCPACVAPQEDEPPKSRATPASGSSGHLRLHE
jgi:hypothetical protein